MKQEQKDSIEHLMFHIQKNNYKEMCDKIKVAILDKFIELAKTRGYLSIEELKLIRMGIDDARSKDKEAETQAIVSVIDNLIARGDDNLPKIKEVKRCE
jgi:hypothetical protein